MIFFLYSNFVDYEETSKRDSEGRILERKFFFNFKRISEKNLFSSFKIRQNDELVKDEEDSKKKGKIKENKFGKYFSNFSFDLRNQAEKIFLNKGSFQSIR